MTWWADLLVALAAGLVVTWLGLVAVLLAVRPSRAVIGQAARLLPDLVRLLTRLARDPQISRGVRIRLWLLLGYLASPIDVVPDFIPVLGFADDAIVVVAVLRSVARSAGREPLRRHWPGTTDGLAVVERLAGLSERSTKGGSS
ncbi:MAG TPA: DUF1232 domain-containing protein [Mycobacteriales bacterium]